METKKDMVATYYYLLALTEPDGGRPFTTVMDKLGEVKLYVYTDKRAPNRIAYMRKPRILVYDKGSNALSGFAAVFICDTPEGNDYLATMEDLAHTRWHQEEARNWSADERDKGWQVLKHMRAWVRDTLQSLASRDQESEQDIVDLADYLPADDESGDNDGRGVGEETREGQDEPETGLEVPRPIEPTELLPRGTSRKPSGLVNLEKEGSKSSDDPESGTGHGGEDSFGIDPEGGGSGEGPGPRPPGPGPRPPSPEPGPGPGPGPGPEPSEPSEPGSGTGSGKPGGPVDPDAPGHERFLVARDVSFRSYARSITEYRIVLRANRDCEGALHLRAVGEDSRYDLDVMRVSSGGDSFVCDGTTILGLKLKKGQSLPLDVEIRSDVKLSLGAGK